MKNFFILTILSIVYFFCASFKPLFALDFYELQKNNVVPRACNEQGASCPQELRDIYGNSCAANYDDFKQNPHSKHYWIEDPDITSQGKANERARQFLDWTLSKSAVDNAPILRQIWQTTQGYALFFVVLVAAIFGIGIIVSRRTNFQVNIEVWPTFIRIGMMILFILFSAALVLSMIQLSEVIMLFFIENLGGRNLFNIYFSANGGTLGGSETNYTEFVGCRDLNIRVQEGIDTELFLLKMTNITYYVMGIMVILRKILLWFMLFIAPFLALLMPFVFIRNIGWIWMGVFFQWLFYGPLFAIFLGALNKIWQGGIPFQFDFSRTNKASGYVYPTGINITYGGPAQIANAARGGNGSIGALNNGNYIDTFVEYVITLIMLWAVTFFPWWLLRIFRDYCCDGIYAMKNILLAMYDQSRSGGPKPKTPDGVLPSLKANLKIEKEEDIKKTVKISTMEEIRKTQTEDLTKSLSLRVSKLTDIARLETNKQMNSVVQKNLSYLSNPIKAKIPTEKQQFMNLRTELFNRAVKQDSVARTVLQSTSTSQFERVRAQRELVKGIGQLVSSSANMSSVATTAMIDKVATSLNTSQKEAKRIIENYTRASTQQMSRLAAELHTSVDKVRDTLRDVGQQQQKTVSTVMSSYMTKLSNQSAVVSTVSQRTKLSQEQVKSIFKAYAGSIAKPVNQVINNISNVTNISQSKVQQALQQTYGMMTTRTFITDFAAEKNVDEIKLKQAINTVATTKSAETTDVTGPQAGPPTQPTKEEAQVQVQEQTQAAVQEEKQIVQALAQDLVQNEEVLQQVEQETGTKQEEIQAALSDFGAGGEPQTVVQTVLKVVSENVAAAEEISKEIAQAEQIDEKEATKVIEEQLEVAAAPEKNIEKTVAVPQSISIEEYEEIKQMWTEQYEEGEIPTTENIQTRDEWVEQDVVMITNIMNKILSEDEQLQQQGLDELGFIIPIFMINNLKGEQLIVYLKAKLEAAKAVKKDLAKEKRMRAKFEKEMKQKEDDEELVEIKKPKEEAKHMEMEMDLDEDKKEKTIEDLGNAPEMNPEMIDPKDDPLASIKSKLEEKAGE